jgi:hypothetical protein
VEIFVKSEDGRTRQSASAAGFCARNGFRTRCASDLISGTFATHVFETGVRRCAYLPGPNKTHGFVSMKECYKATIIRWIVAPCVGYPGLFYVFDVLEHELDGIDGRFA